MGHSVSVEKVEPKKFELPGNGKVVLLAMMGLGVAGLAAGFVVDKERVWHAYLTSYFYFASLAIGGLFFTAIQHAVRAGWSVNIRRISESMVAFMPIVAGGGLVLLAAGSDLYLWLDKEVVAKDAILSGKEGYLNLGFWAVRMVMYAGLWLFFGKTIVDYSVAQDKDGDEKWTHRLVPFSVAFLLVFALSYSLFSVDLLMSLEPHWFSTIFGVYCFAGLFQSTLAFMILMILFCRSQGWVTGLMTMEHVHDVAKFLKGFTVFWAYIAFSQFMLIWYANLPEETVFYLHRSHGGWMYISLSLLVFKFVVPFVALLPRWAKRTPRHLVMVCSLVLIMQYVDIYWMVYPNYTHDFVAFSWMEVLTFIGFAGAFLFMVSRWLGKHNLVPIKDPRIHESLNHHVTY
jgi:hypothetical protein